MFPVRLFLFQVSSGFLEQCSALQLDSLPFIHPFEKSSLEIYKAHLQQMISDILKESFGIFNKFYTTDNYLQLQTFLLLINRPITWLLTPTKSFTK